MTPLATITYNESAGDTEMVIHVSEGFEIKEELKAAGFSWSDATKTWVYRETFDSNRDLDKFAERMISKLEDMGCEVE